MWDPIHIHRHVLKVLFKESYSAPATGRSASAREAQRRTSFRRLACQCASFSPRGCWLLAARPPRPLHSRLARLRVALAQLARTLRRCLERTQPHWVASGHAASRAELLAPPHLTGGCFIWLRPQERAPSSHTRAVAPCPASEPARRDRRARPGWGESVLLVQRGQLADVHRLAQPKVGQLHVPARVQQQVVGLDIPAPRAPGVLQVGAQLPPAGLTLQAREQTGPSKQADMIIPGATRCTSTPQNRREQARSQPAVLQGAEPQACGHLWM